MDEDTSPYNCMNNCVYTEDGNPGSKVCFKEGDLATKCAPDSGEYKMKDCPAVLLYHNIQKYILHVVTPALNVMDFLKTAAYQNHFADTTHHLDFALTIIPKLVGYILVDC